MWKQTAQSSAAVRQFFQWIESNWGGRLPMDPHAHVITRHRYFEPEDLQALMHHKALAIHVKEFYPPSSAQALAKTLLTTESGSTQNWKISTSRGLESSDVATLGAHPPYNVAVAQKQQAAYFEGVQTELRSRRLDNENTPQLWPLDLLRLQLDEQWPAGAGLAKNNDNTKCYGGGLARIMKGPTRWKRGFIHVDDMGPLNNQLGLFSANIYLQFPNKEEETSSNEQHDIMHIWPTNLRSRWDWYRNAVLLSGLSSSDPEGQARLYRALKHDTVTLRGQAGDLILLCVQRPHAAVGFTNTDGTRVSLQCFLQHQGPQQRLLIDS